MQQQKKQQRLAQQRPPQQQQQQYVALIGDVVASRNLTQRGRVQKELQQSLSDINAQYADDVASALTLTLGDEFQGLLHDAGNVFEIIDRIRLGNPTLQFRWGLGLGSMATDINPNISIGADGQAYWLAREAIEAVRGAAASDFGQTKTLLRCPSVQLREQTLINNSLRLCDYIESRWRDSQRDFVQGYVRAWGYNRKVPQKELAATLGISQQAVSGRLRDSGLRQYLDTKCDIARYLGDLIATAS